MLFPGMSLAQYLEVIGHASPTEGPYNGHAAADVLNPAFAELVKGTVAFVNAAKPIIGYEETRDMLESVVHGFPATEEPEPVDFMALFGELLREALEDEQNDADGPLVTEADDK
ncbi:hypothetical protein SEA_SNEK_60 [Arthrobacter phage Snek]|uniref:Uncharacterized protein n=1 Tax=Arthrobacter phage Tweety19 TaxID=2768133 RepID=A0A7G9W257_9CAUD|nr:hypothetical protein PQE19_gp48 [Arthrobacter phage Tweety19]QNO12720.1 hypothetical protein SEA_TWEETY19_61 [Arthrobacter phage Tweety19]